MHIFFIKKKTIMNILFVVILVGVSIVYTKGPGMNVIGVFLNNERIMPIYSVDVPDRRVALTFDAAWGNEHTQSIIDNLKRYNIKATFFITGAWAEKFPDMVKTIQNGGHEIGNHSATHIKMTELTKENFKREIKDAEESILKITGNKTKLFRLPYGEYNNKVISWCKQLDYDIIQWDVNSNDWRNISEQEISEAVFSSISCGSIILFHNNAANTPKALPDIIEKLRKDGYNFVTVSELVLKENYYIDNTGRQKSLK